MKIYKITEASGCQGHRDFEGDFDCDYQTTLMCEDCKYGVGRKDPAARCNALHPEKIIRTQRNGKAVRR